MSRLSVRLVALTATTAALLVGSAAAASADPACAGPAAAVLHAAHEAVGDPTGAIHAGEEIACSVG